MRDELKEKVYSIIQTFLKNPPVIIWGSGATIPYGLPTMGDLNQALKDGINNFNPTNENLEIELGKNAYETQMPEIRKIIWNTVNNAENKIIHKLINSETDELNAIKNMIDKFRSAHPQVVNIITTNYDRVLEHIAGYHNIPFSDGFIGREFSTFSNIHFKDKNIVNLIKVHGSLSWFQVGSNIRYLMVDHVDSEPLIISPGKNKYQEAYKNPYRDLIQKSDSLINSAHSFLVIGFGFNDEHLTPKIKEKVNNGTPLVLITKQVSESCHNELKDAQKYVLLEENGVDGATSVSLKSGTVAVVEKHTIDGNYWQLKQFMEIL